MYDLWAHLHNEHDLTLVESEIHEIVRLAAPGWQPIETAPKDGTELLLYWFDPGGKTYFAAAIPGSQPEPPSHNVKIGFWQKLERTNREELGEGLVRETKEVYSEGWADKSKYFFVSLSLNPTHWMPLPTPPQA